MIPASVVVTRKILLIEDQKSDVVFVQKLLREILPPGEYAFLDAPRMIEALELIDKYSDIDLIVLDLNLLDIEGAASVTALRAEAPGVTILVYSGSEDPNLRQDAILCGAHYYIAKGDVSSGNFKYMVHEALKKSCA